MSNQRASNHHSNPSDGVEDRPLSVYDNLHGNSQTQATPIYSTPIKTKYNNNNLQYSAPSQLQQPQSNAYMNLPQVGNNFTTSPTPSQVSPNTTVTTLPINDYHKFNSPSSITSTSTPNRHSDSYDSSLSRAAVKAALNQAKSRFFGLEVDQDTNTEPLNPSKTTYILPQTRPYQNIPESSPSYRQPQEPQQQSAVFYPPPQTHSAQPQNNSPEPQHSETNGKRAPNTQSMMDLASSKPSQEVYMKTTVPQNIRNINLGGRHTPTRTSLRHSRIVVMSKGYSGIKDKNPLNLQHPSLAKVLLILQILFGVAIACLGLWILYWAPSTRLQDNPYWSGVSLLFAGILGLLLMSCRRMKRSKVRESCFVFVKFDSFLLSLVAALLCVIAGICATLHLVRLSADDTKCESSDILVQNSSCVCIFNYKNGTQGVENSNDFFGGLSFLGDNYRMDYKDLTCNEVEGCWIGILAFSIVLNILGCLFTLMYLCLVMCFRVSPDRYNYTSVQTNVNVR